MESSLLKLPFKLWVIILFCFLRISILLAESVPSESMLPLTTQRLINCMTTGPEGFLWIGTERGLYRYDGHRYVSYNNGLKKPYYISHNNVFDVFPTQDSLLVLYNDMHTVDILDPVSHHLTSINLSDKTNPQGEIRYASRQSDGRIFFITESDEGYVVFEYQNNNFKKLFERKEKRLTNPKMTAIGSPRFYLVSQVDSTLILYDQENGIFHFREDGGLINHFYNQPEIAKSEPFSFFQQEKPGVILFAKSEKKGLYRLDVSSGIVELDLRFPSKDIYSYCRRDEVGNFMIGVKGDDRRLKGALLLDMRGSVYPVRGFSTYRPINEFSYSQDYSQFFFGITTEGLTKVKSGIRSIESFLGGQDISMRGMMEDGKGNLIVATELHGWYTLDMVSGVVSPIYLKGLNIDDLTPPQYARNLVKDDRGEIWISAYGNPPVTSTPHGYLLRYRPSNGQVKVYKNKSRIEALLIDHTGKIYLASNGVLQFFDPVKEQITDVLDNYGFPIQEGVIPNCIIQSRDRSIWVGTEKGLVHYDTSGIYEVYGKGDITLFSNENVMSIYEDSKGMLWLGTQGGLYYFDPHNRQLELFTKRDGLPDNNVCGIISDSKENLWVSTFKGLSYFEREAKHFRNFFKSDGFNHSEFNRHSFYLTQDSTFYFGGMDGFNSFKAEELLDKKAPVRILFSEIAYFDLSGDSLLIRTNGLNNFQSVTLPAANRYLQVRFGIDNYSQSEQNSYSVYLEGYDSDWVSQGNVAEVRYNNLPPGSYRLHVKGIGPSGTQTDNTIQLDILVKQFFYNSPWFYLLLFLLSASLLVIWIDRLKTEKNRLIIEVEKRTAQISSDKETIEKQAKELQTLDRMKSRFFANISHELRTPLTLILSPLKRILSNKSMDSSTIQRHLALMEKNGVLLLHRIEELLELSRLEAGKSILKESHLEFEAFIRQIFDRFIPIAEQKSIDLIWNCKLDLAGPVLLDAYKFENIIGNLLSNALKFTSEGRVELQVSNYAAKLSTHGQEYICIKVLDTGVGISGKELPYVFDRYFQANNSTSLTGGTGIGLSMAKEFTELMGGEIKAESKIGQGSIFTLILPVKVVLGDTFRNQKLDDVILTNIPTETKESKKDYFLGIKGLKANEFTILLAEDNRDLRSYLIEILSSHFQVVAMENGKQALEYLEQQRHPIRNLLILSDVMMPEMDGFVLLESVRSREHFRRIPFVMLTAKTGGENRLRALRMGIDDYLLKPFSEEELVARIANLLNNLKIRQQAEVDGLDSDLESENDQYDWLQTLENTVLKSLTDPRMGLEFLAENMEVSLSSLHRRIKAETGLTPNMYLREIRLQEARRLFENNLVKTVAETAHKVGILKRSYFSKLYQERFGRLPSSYFEDNGS